MKYFKTLPKPVKPWGKQGPHDSRYGLFALGNKVQRQIDALDVSTCERIHLSVLEQLPENGIMPEILDIIQRHPEVVERHLLPLEREMRTSWKYTPGQTPHRQDTVQYKTEKKREEKLLESIQEASKKAAKKTKAAKSKIVSLKNKALGDSVTSLEESVVDEEEDERVAENAEEGGDSSFSLLRTNTHYEESSVAPIWNELMGKD